MGNYKSSTDKKRRSYNYRREYFKKYPGYLGCIWFCSQCKKPIIGKKNVQVDHILALNAGGANKRFNLVAICKKCNLKKSDKTGIYLVNGMVSKILEVLTFGIQDLVVSVFKILTAFIFSKIGLIVIMLFFVYYIYFWR